MRKIITFFAAILFCQIYFAQINTAPKSKGNPCPPPRFKKGQTPAQVREDTRKYVECVAQASRKREAEKQQRRDANRVGDNPSRGSSNPRNASNNNGGRQRQDANKERDHQRYEQRQRENQQRRQEAEKQKRERDGNY